jgi:hypothetical protein
MPPIRNDIWDDSIPPVESIPPYTTSIVVKPQLRLPPFPKQLQLPIGTTFATVQVHEALSEQIRAHTAISLIADDTKEMDGYANAIDDLLKGSTCRLSDRFTGHMHVYLQSVSF